MSTTVAEIEQRIYNCGEMITVSKEQLTLLSRWYFVDQAIREGELTRSAIAILLTKRFNIDITTARRDIVNAEDVFSKVHVNKKDGLTVLIQTFEDYIVKAATSSDWNAVAVLGKQLSDLSFAHPNTTVKQSARTLILNILNQKLGVLIDVQKAMFFIEEALLHANDEEDEDD